MQSPCLAKGGKTRRIGGGFREDAAIMAATGEVRQQGPEMSPTARVSLPPDLPVRDDTDKAVGIGREDLGQAAEDRSQRVGARDGAVTFELYVVRSVPDRSSDASDHGAVDQVDRRFPIGA